MAVVALWGIYQSYHRAQEFPVPIPMANMSTVAFPTTPLWSAMCNKIVGELGIAG